MLFPEKKSALVRLSDMLKIGLDTCAVTSHRILDLFTPYEPIFREAQRMAREALRDGVTEETDDRIRKVLSAVPEDVSWNGVRLQGQLHSEALSTILSCCFCLESYVNSLAYFLFEETDFLGLIKDGHKVSAELVLEAIERMTTRKKWETVGRLRGGPGLDRARAPFQDFQILFNFRDDHVHDKVVDYSDNRATKRYNGKLPDPVTGLLDLGHALYCAQTYWDMVHEIHKLIGVDEKAFHRHYNLSPWVNDDHRRELEDLAAHYKEKLGSRGTV